jgi:hypothetical protein
VTSTPLVAVLLVVEPLPEPVLPLVLLLPEPEPLPVLPDVLLLPEPLPLPVDVVVVVSAGMRETVVASMSTESVRR